MDVTGKNTRAARARHNSPRGPHHVRIPPRATSATPGRARRRPRRRRLHRYFRRRGSSRSLPGLGPLRARLPARGPTGRPPSPTFLPRPRPNSCGGRAGAPRAPPTRRAVSSAARRKAAAGSQPGQARAHKFRRGERVGGREGGRARRARRETWRGGGGGREISSSTVAAAASNRRRWLEAEERRGLPRRPPSLARDQP